jgi:uncharacterized lipoprotein YehR (DUF1307 family)
MKSAKKLMILLFAFFMIAAAAGCTKVEDLFGVWEYRDTERDFTAVYEFREDGTGTYTVNSEGKETVYELRYNAEGSHLLFTITNSEDFSDDDLFDIQFKLKGGDTMVIKDSRGADLKFIRK